MASIVLSTVGRAVGTYFGGPIGGQIGATIGGSIGSKIDGTKKYKYEGARLEELAVQTSTYGKAIPKIWGSVRLAGNVIWSRPIKELVTKTTVSGGGKGAGGGGRSKTTQSDYSYYITLAIAICEGELTRVDRVWADAKLLDLSQGTYRLYTGKETQLADPLIESFEGVGKTPAYRGMAYVVIEDFPLGDFGNRIPNFTFEVTRRSPQRDGATPVESAVKSIMLIPGSGEFVYDTQGNYKIPGENVRGKWVQNGYKVPLNQHTADGKANVLVALDQMQQTFPNLEWVGIVVDWFGTTMDIGTCEIWPGVEYQTNATTDPNVWSVAGLTRSTARQIGNDAGVIRYGGTPDDAGIIRLCNELKSRGLKVFFNPMMLMDVAGKPWRGTLTGATTDVGTFFTKAHGYKDFILYYANLLVGKIDAFAIGSELRDLTKITSSAGVFPAVSQLVTLAGQVKTILGSGVKVTYAADWSEYHHTDNGWYHLDPLWSSAAIDVVGIDAYFPLSNAVQTDYNIDTLKAGWTSGEGYDWYYSDVGRTVQMPLTAAYAWKNIDYWWKNTHVNPNSIATSWVPQSKPVWFTEYGFASVDGCANEPNVFVDATTGSSSYPRFSRGRVDFMAQRTAIAATEAQWGSNSVVSRRFLWTWDARPYPYWPDLHSVWADGASWVTGHWVQGKLGGSHVAAVVEDIAAAAGCDLSLIDTSALQLVMDGFILNQRTSARAAIEQLMQAYFFQLKESGGKLVALPRRSTVTQVLEAEECLALVQDAREISYQLERTEDLSLPDKIEVHSLNRLQNYATHVQSAQRGTQSANEVATLPLALVMSEAQGRAVAQNLLADRWAERSNITMQLPVKYAALEPGDILLLGDGALAHRIRIQQVQLGRPGMLRVRGVIDASNVWDGYVPPTIGGSGASVTPPAATELALLDIPAFPGDAQNALTVRIAMCGQAENWNGASLLRVNTGGENQLLAEVTTPSVMGSCTTILANGRTQVMDYSNTLDVSLLGEGMLASVTESVMLNGANTAMVGSEIIQFATATLLSPGKYQLKTLLRGRLGTEWAVAGHVANERFVLLDALVVPLELSPTALGQSWTLRAVTAGTMLNTGTEITQTISGVSLKSYAPVAVQARIDSGNNITFSWIRRARIDGGLRDLVDVPLMEQTEAYEVIVFNGSAVVRTWQATIASQVYTSVQQISDFGSLQTSYTVKITQKSAIVGPGISFLGSVAVQ